MPVKPLLLLTDDAGLYPDLDPASYPQRRAQHFAMHHGFSGSVQDIAPTPPPSAVALTSAAAMATRGGSPPPATRGAIGSLPGASGSTDGKSLRGARPGQVLPPPQHQPQLAFGGSAASVEDTSNSFSNSASRGLATAVAAAAQPEAPIAALGRRRSSIRLGGTSSGGAGTADDGTTAGILGGSAGSGGPRPGSFEALLRDAPAFAVSRIAGFVRENPAAQWARLAELIEGYRRAASHGVDTAEAIRLLHTQLNSSTHAAAQVAQATAGAPPSKADEMEHLAEQERSTLAAINLLDHILFFARSLVPALEPTIATVRAYVFRALFREGSNVAEATNAHTFDGVARCTSLTALYRSLEPFQLHLWSVETERRRIARDVAQTKMQSGSMKLVATVLKRNMGSWREAAVRSVFRAWRGLRSRRLAEEARERELVRYRGEVEFLKRARKAQDERILAVRDDASTSFTEFEGKIRSLEAEVARLSDRCDGLARDNHALEEQALAHASGKDADAAQQTARLREELRRVLVSLRESQNATQEHRRQAAALSDELAAAQASTQKLAGVLHERDTLLDHVGTLAVGRVAHYRELLVRTSDLIERGQPFEGVSHWVNVMADIAIHRGDAAVLRGDTGGAGGGGGTPPASQLSGLLPPPLVTGLAAGGLSSSPGSALGGGWGTNSANRVSVKQLETFTEGAGAVLDALACVLFQCLAVSCTGDPLATPPTGHACANRLASTQDDGSGLTAASVCEILLNSDVWEKAVFVRQAACVYLARGPLSVSAAAVPSVEDLANDDDPDALFAFACRICQTWLLGLVVSAGDGGDAVPILHAAATATSAVAATPPSMGPTNPTTTTSLGCAGADGAASVGSTPQSGNGSFAGATSLGGSGGSMGTTTGSADLRGSPALGASWEKRSRTIEICAELWRRASVALTAAQWQVNLRRWSRIGTEPSSAGMSDAAAAASLSRQLTTGGQGDEDTVNLPSVATDNSSGAPSNPHRLTIALSVSPKLALPESRGISVTPRAAGVGTKPPIRRRRVEERLLTSEPATRVLLRRHVRSLILPSAASAVRNVPSLDNTAAAQSMNDMLDSLADEATTTMLQFADSKASVLGSVFRAYANLSANSHHPTLVLSPADAWKLLVDAGYFSEGATAGGREVVRDVFQSMNSARKAAQAELAKAASSTPALVGASEERAGTALASRDAASLASSFGSAPNGGAAAASVVAASETGSAGTATGGGSQFEVPLEEFVVFLLRASRVAQPARPGAAASSMPIAASTPTASSVAGAGAGGEQDGFHESPASPTRRTHLERAVDAIQKQFARSLRLVTETGASNVARIESALIRDQMASLDVRAVVDGLRPALRGVFMALVPPGPSAQPAVTQQQFAQFVNTDLKLIDDTTFSFVGVNALFLHCQTLQFNKAMLMCFSEFVVAVGVLAWMKYASPFVPLSTKFARFFATYVLPPFKKRLQAAEQNASGALQQQNGLLSVQSVRIPKSPTPKSPIPPSQLQPPNTTQPGAASDSSGFVAFSMDAPSSAATPEPVGRSGPVAARRGSFARRGSLTAKNVPKRGATESPVPQPAE